MSKSHLRILIFSRRRNYFLFIGYIAFFLTSCDPTKQSSQVDTTPVTGREIYRTKCASCHQADGSGIPRICPPLATSPRLVGRPEDLVRIVLLGMKGAEVRDGVTYNGIMPAWRFDLTDSQIADVLNEILTRWSPHTARISPSLVKSIREETAYQKLFMKPDQLEISTE